MLVNCGRIGEIFTQKGIIIEKGDIRDIVHWFKHITHNRSGAPYRTYLSIVISWNVKSWSILYRETLWIMKSKQHLKFFNCVVLLNVKAAETQQMQSKLYFENASGKSTIFFPVYDSNFSLSDFSDLMWWKCFEWTILPFKTRRFWKSSKNNAIT